MNRKIFIYTAAAVLINACLTGGTALAETEIMNGSTVLSGEVTAGVQQKIVDGASPKFEEYRDVRQGVVIGDIRLRVENLGNLYFLDLKAKDPLQDDESYRLNAGKHGRFNLGVSHDKTPHNFSNGLFLLNHTGGGQFRIGDNAQSFLEQ